MGVIMACLKEAGKTALDRLLFTNVVIKGHSRSRKFQVEIRSRVEVFVDQ